MEERRDAAFAVATSSCARAIPQRIFDRVPARGKSSNLSCMTIFAEYTIHLSTEQIPTNSERIPDEDASEYLTRSVPELSALQASTHASN